MNINTTAERDPADEVFDVRGAARYLHIHPETALRLLKAGELPGRKVGRAWRVHRAELEAFLRRPPSTEQAAGEPKTARRA